MSIYISLRRIVVPIDERWLTASFRPARSSSGQEGRSEDITSRKTGGRDRGELGRGQGDGPGADCRGRARDGGGARRRRAACAAGGRWPRRRDGAGGCIGSGGRRSPDSRAQARSGGACGG